MANKINVVLGIDTGQFERSLNAMSKRMQRFAADLQSAGSTLTQAITLPLAGAGAAALSTAAKYETLRVSLSTLLGSAEKGADAFDRLAEFAAKTPFQLEDVAAGAKQLLAFGLNIDEVYDSLSFLGDIAGATGSNLQDLTLIFGQARSIGAAYTQDLRQLAQRGVPVFDLLSEKTGLTGDALRKFIEQGKVTFPLLQDLLKSTAQEGGLFFGGMEAQSKTLTGVFSTFKDNVSLALAKIGDAIANSINLREVMGRLSDAVARAAEWFGNLSPGMQKVIVIAAAAAAALGPVLFVIGKLIAVGPVLVMGLKAIGTAFAIMTGPVGLTIAAIGAVVAAVVFAYNKFEGFRRVVNGLGNTIKELFNILKEGGAAFIRAFGELKEGEFRKAAKSIEEGIRKTNPVTIAFTEGKRLKDAFTDGFADDTNYLKKVQKDFQKAVSGAGISGAVAPLAPLAPAGGGTGTARKKTSISAPLQTLKTDIPTLEQFGKSGAANANLQTYSETLAKLKGEQAGFFADMERNAQAAAIAVQESLAQVNVALLANGETYINWGNILQNAALIGISSFAQTVEQGISSLKQFGKAVKAAAVEIIGALIKQGVTSIVSNTLIKLGGALGPLAIPLAAAAGSLAKGIFTSAIASISTPRLARGGITTGETLAVVGDNPSGKEAIIPFERMGEFLNMAGAQAVRLTGLFEVKGSDLVLVLDRAQQEKLRIR